MSPLRWPRRKVETAQPTGNVHIYRDAAGEYRFRVTSPNGKIPGQEGYVSPSNAFAGALALRRALERPTFTEDDFTSGGAS